LVVVVVRLLMPRMLVVVVVLVRQGLTGVARLVATVALVFP
jgi:hypothetical protein